MIEEINKTNKETLHTKINSIKTGGTTNLCGGLLQGIEVLHGQELTPDYISSIVLLTDGHANVGMTSPDDICTAVQNEMNKLSHTRIYTLGFGTNHNENLLNRISKTTEGLYYFIETQDNIPTSFGEILGGLVSVVAQNIKIGFNIADPTALTKFQLLSDYKTSIKDNRVIVELGDLYSEEIKNIVFDHPLQKVEESTPGLGQKNAN